MSHTGDSRTMIVTIPLITVGRDRLRHSLKFIDFDKEEYQVLHVIEEKKGKTFEIGTVHVLGHAKKLDIKRLGKVS